MACGLFKLLRQNAVLRQDEKGVHHRLVRSVSDAFSFGQGVLGLDVVPGTHVRSPQPRVGPRLGVVAIHRARQIGEDLLRLGVVALQVVRLANDGVVVVDPLVHDRPAERLGHPLGRGHGVAVHHARAFLDGPLHQWENLLGAFLVRLQEQGQNFVPTLLVELFQFDLGLRMRFVRVEEAVVLRGGVVVEPVGPPVSLGGARHPRQRHQGGNQDQEAA